MGGGASKAPTSADIVAASHADLRRKVSALSAEQQRRLALALAQDELLAAIAEAASAAPLPPEGAYPETWDGGSTFHWSLTKHDNLPADSARVQAERRVLNAIKAVDAAEALGPAPAGGKCAASRRSVRVSWLVEFTKKHVPREWSTADVVERIIKAQTSERRCRYVDLLGKEDVGDAALFCSHTWRASFVDLVAAIAHVAAGDTFVWIDIFAVRQWPGNDADLDFRPVVRDAAAFLLVAQHVEEVTKMKQEDALSRRVPEAAERLCAFFRVWCARRPNPAPCPRSPRPLSALVALTACVISRSAVQVRRRAGGGGSLSEAGGHADRRGERRWRRVCAEWWDARQTL